MGTKRGSLGLAAGLALAVVGAAWLLSPRAADLSPPRLHRDAESAVDSEELPSIPESPDALDSFSGSVRGTIRRNGRPARARVEVRRLCDEPSWSPSERSARLLFDCGLVDPEPGTPAAIAASGEDGRFLVGGLRPGHYEVRAAAAEGGSAAHRITLSPRLRDAVIDLSVAAGDQVLPGRARFADGRPFHGLVWVGDRRREMGSGPVRTDADGRFTIRGLAPGCVRLSAARGAEWSARLTTVRLPAPGEVEVVVDEEWVLLAGRVLRAADGEPVGGALVVAGDYWGGAGAVETDVDGAFRLRSPDCATLRVLAPGFSPCSLSLWGGARDNLVIPLVPAATVTGVLRDAATGRPVAGIPVYAWRLGYGGGGVGTRSRADGRFDLAGTPSGIVTVFAAGGGRVSASLVGKRAPPVLLRPGEAREVDLELVPLARAEGRVVDAEGRGVGDCRVVVCTEKDWDCPYRLRRLLAPPAISGPDGRFSFGGLLPGVAWSFVATGPDGGWGRVGPYPVPKTGRTGIEIPLSGPRWLDVVVRDAVTGAPVAGARVDTQGSGWPLCWGHTDMTGEVRLGPFREAPEVARAAHPEFVEVQDWTPVVGVGPVELGLSPGKVEAGGPAVPTRLAPEGVPDAVPPVLLRVVDARGFPVASAEVSLYPRTYSSCMMPEFPGVGGGEAEIRPWPGDGVEIFGFRDGTGVPLPLGAVLVTNMPPPGGELLVRPPPERAIEGVLIDDTGAGVPGARLEAYPEKECCWFAHSGASTDGEGRFRLGGLWDGSYVVVCDPPDGYCDPEHTRGVSSGTRDLTIVTSVLRQVRGRVVDPEGRGLPACDVTARPGGGFASKSGETGADGSFEIGGLASRPVVLTVERAGPESASTRIETEVAAGEKDVRIVFDPGGVLRVEVEGGSQEVKGATARLFRRDPGDDPGTVRESHGALDEHGRITFSDLDREKAYTLWVGPTPDGQCAWVEGVQAGERLLSVPLVRGRSIRGRVVLPAGRKSARVEVRRLEYCPWSGDVGGDGSFVVGGLPEGAYRVSASYWGDGDWIQAEADVRAGESVTLIPVRK